LQPLLAQLSSPNRIEGGLATIENVIAERSLTGDEFNSSNPLNLAISPALSVLVPDKRCLSDDNLSGTSLSSSIRDEILRLFKTTGSWSNQLARFPKFSQSSSVVSLMTSSSNR
jgi:hypothetical protein